MASTTSRWFSRVARVFVRKTSVASPQFDVLDGLRGVAVLFVVVSHLSAKGLYVLPGLNFEGSGKYGVYLFFSLSAFLLTHQILIARKDQLSSPRYWARYAARRVLRIFPLYAFALGIGVWGTSAGSAHVIPMTGQSFLRHMLLEEGRDIYWTIPVEFKYYVVLPFVALFFAVPLRSRPQWVIPTALASIAACATLLWPGEGSSLRTLDLGPYLPIFLAGSLAAFVHQRVSARGGLQSGTARAALEIAALACLGGILSMVPAAWRELSGVDIAKQHFHRDFWLFGLLWSVVLLAAIHARGPLQTVFSNRALRFVGVVSFSLYLWHLSVNSLVHRSFPIDQLPGAWVAIAASLVVAALSYAFVERPFLRLGARIGRSQLSGR